MIFHQPDLDAFGDPAPLPVHDPPMVRWLGLDGGGLPRIYSLVPHATLEALDHPAAKWARFPVRGSYVPGAPK